MRQINIVVGFMLCITCGCNQAPSISSTDIETEARTFMEAYAQEIRDHDVAAIARRYDSTGVYFLGGGRKSFEPFDSVRTRYMERWKGPKSFEWHDLSYEILSPNAVLVLGRLSWGREDSLDALNVSYTGLLKRQGGMLRIRLEDESADPLTIKEFICSEDTTGP